MHVKRWGFNLFGSVRYISFLMLYTFSALAIISGVCVLKTYGRDYGIVLIPCMSSLTRIS